MNKNEYLNQLSMLLTDLSPTERQEAIQYYDDYISDAGEENETAVLQELGSPQKLASDIKAGLGINSATAQNVENNQNSSFQNGLSMAAANAGNNGPGNSGFWNNNAQSQGTASSQGKVKDPVKIALWVLLIIVTSPIWLSIVSGVFSLLLGILSTIVGVVIATLAIGLSFIVVCVLLVIIGVVKVFSLPLCSVLLIGIALLFGGVGIYSLILCYLLCTKTLPWLFYGSINLFKKCYVGVRKTVIA